MKKKKVYKSVTTTTTRYKVFYCNGCGHLEEPSDCYGNTFSTDGYDSIVSAELAIKGKEIESQETNCPTYNKSYHFIILPVVYVDVRVKLKSS